MIDSLVGVTNDIFEMSDFVQVNSTEFSNMENNTDLLIIDNFIDCLEERSRAYNLSYSHKEWLYIFAYYFNETWILPSEGLEDNLENNSSPQSTRVINLLTNPTIESVIDDCRIQEPIERPYLLVWWKQLLWTLVFGAMLTCSIMGNVIVMWIVVAHRRMRTVTNYFLMNLSLADLLMSVLNCMFNFIFMLHSDWPFGAVYCIISNFMANVTIAASVFTLTAISLDRYLAIVKPLEPRMSKTVARICISTIWTASMVLAIPCLLFSTTVSITYKNDELRRGCILQWPDGESSPSHQEHIYNIIFFITTYLLPMVVMLVSYSLIGKELWGSRSIGELTERQVNGIRSKRRVVKMFMVIVSIFALCWLPQQAFFLYQYHNEDVLKNDHIQHIYLSIYWFAMANAMVNPIIYYWMNARFRAYFRDVILHCTCLRYRQKHRFNASPVLVRREIPLEENSSRSKSGESRTNRTRTTPGPLKSKNHILLYSSRERLHQRNGWWRNNGPNPFKEERLSGEGSSGGGHCDHCLQTLKPPSIVSDPCVVMNGSSLSFPLKVIYSKSSVDLVSIERMAERDLNYSH